MKCKKCNYKNIIKAKYCEHCGNKFNDEERKKAYQKTIYYKIEILKKWYDMLSLEVITGHLAFKILSVVIIFGFGIYNLLTIGINTKILASEDYKIYYNKNNGEYYLIVNDNLDEINLKLYKPNRLKKLNVVHYNNDNNIIEEMLYTDNLLLNTYQNDYYILKSKYGENNIEQLKITIYHQEDINFNN